MRFILVGKYKELNAVNVFLEVSFNHYKLGFQEYIDENQLNSLRDLLMSYVNREVLIRYPLFTSFSAMETLINAGYHDDNIPLDEIDSIDLSYTNVRNFEPDTFQNIYNLRFINFPETLEVIPERAFANYQNLDSLILPKKLREIGSYAFVGCSSLTTVVIPNSVALIGELAFDDLEFIIVELDKKPVGWHENWAGNTKRIHWIKK